MSETMSFHSESNEMRLAAGFRPDPLGSLQRSPRPPSWTGGSRQGGLCVFTVGGVDAPAAAPSASVPAASVSPATSEATSSTVVHASGSWPTDSESPQISSDHRANDDDRQIQRHPNQPMDVVFPTDTNNRKFLTSWNSSFGWIDYDLDSRTIWYGRCLHT